jgi:diacylglycerol O-acyltransferase
MTAQAVGDPDGAGAGALPAGVSRLRPDDHFMVLLETDATPMHIGALLLLEGDGSRPAVVADRLRQQLMERLPATPLPATLHPAPDGYDSDVWVDVDLGDLDVDHHVVVVPEVTDEPGLRAFVAAQSMERLDLTRPPFRAFLFPAVGRDHSALYLQVHHAVTDGVGFQTLLGLLSDETPASGGGRVPGILPTESEWMRLAVARFAAEESEREAHRVRSDAALAVLKSGTLPRRAPTPVLKLSGPTSPRRAYATVSVPLGRVRAVSGALGGTVNDAFLACASSALRRYLFEIDDLPADPLVVNSARSYRRPGHGDFGNRIVAMHPHLGTHLADPLARLSAIQGSMAGERARTAYDEAMLDKPDRPWGARDRRARFARREPGESVLPGNVTLSNVPGPSAPRSYAGYRQVSNHPTPLIGRGRFANITSRRNGDALDMGIMVDPDKIADVDLLARFFLAAVDEHEALATGRPVASTRGSGPG